MHSVLARSVAYCLLVTGVLVLPGLVQAQFAPILPEAPKALRPPKGQVLILHLTGKGNQIYQCMRTDRAFSWTLNRPEAKLYGESSEIAGRHYSGPTWEANDGSRVIGHVLASAPSPVADSVPWLLLAMRSRDGTGLMARVQSIQRLGTKGGGAPETSCDASREHEEIGVPYQAEYYFYGAERSGVLYGTSH